MTQTFPAGWNLLAVPSVAETLPLGDVLSATTSVNDVIYDAAGRASVWTDVGWMGTLQTLRADTAYVAFFDRGAEAQFVGADAWAPYERALAPGLHWLSLPPVRIGELRFPFAAGDVLKTRDAFSMYSTYGGWVGELDRLERHTGYKLLVQRGGTLRAP